MVKYLSAKAGDIRDTGLIPGSSRSPGGGNGKPLQYSCLENPMDRGAWWATVHRVAQSWTRLNDLACTHILTHIYTYIQKKGFQKNLNTVVCQAALSGKRSVSNYFSQSYFICFFRDTNINFSDRNFRSFERPNSKDFN